MTLNELYEYLSMNINGYIKFISSSNEIIIRCPYCGDSIKHSNKGHFYIGDKYGSFVYQCKRSECNAVGVLNKKVLEKLNIRDNSFINKLLKHNMQTNTVFNKQKEKFKNINSKFDKIDFINLYNFNDLYIKNKYRYKIEYIRKRLFLDSTVDINLNDYRIILSIHSFLEYFNLYNKLNQYQLSKLNELEKEYIGFMNLTNSIITFRSIKEDSLYRYHKFSLYRGNIDIYSIKQQIDLYSKNNIYLNICEGQFDIINIKNRLNDYFNFNDNENDLNIFVSSGSSDYRTKIDFIVKELGLAYFNIRIFKDTDMQTKYLLNQFRESFYKDNIKVYSNSLGKDFSDNSLKIIEDY